MCDESLKDVLSRAGRLRCPACGTGRLYKSLLQMNESCPHCGLVFEREQGYFVGAIYVNVIVTLFLIVSAFVVSLIVMPEYGSGVQTALFVIAIAVPLILFRHARSIWLSLDYFIDPPKTGKRFLSHG